MNGRAPAAGLQAKAVPAHWRDRTSGMLLPQGSVLANWVLATMSSQGIASLPSGANLARESGPPALGEPARHRLEHLCRGLGARCADSFLRSVLADHHAGERP